MSDSPIPAYVDTRKAFLQEGKTTGFITLDRLPRFVDCLASAKGSVEVELGFDTDQRTGTKIINGRIEALVEVICQRCLEPLEITLSDDINLALIRREADADKLEGDIEPWICEDHKLDVANLVEEQLILCLPLVSYHSDKACIATLDYEARIDADNQPPKGQQKERKENPFAVLEVLKEKDKQSD
jgi:uncharacterized protein